jgi:hypothetical protein
MIARSANAARIAYADPPYIGQAKRHYSHDPLCAEVDHNELLARLVEFDGWALSCSSSSLKQILTLPNCPDDVRIASWVKPFASFKPNVNPAYAWEPVLYSVARKHERTDSTVRDWVSANITLQRGLSGAKPEAFCYWLFALLNIKPGDEFVDMYPGTNGVSVAWQNWKRAQLDKTEQQPLFEAER